MVLALTRLEILVIVATLSLLAALLLPALSRAKSKPSKINCRSNLKQVGLGAILWAADHHDQFPWQVSVAQGGAAEFVQTGDLTRIYQSFSNELGNPRMLTCPSDTKRQPAARRFDGLSAGQLSYFLNTTAIASTANVVMFGDRNLVLNGKPIQPGVVSVRNTDRLTWGKEIHGNRGNVVLVDGRSRQTAADVVPAEDWARQPATNLLVFP